jgi:hypothetical protein
MTFNGVTFEKVDDCSGMGCMTYYFTLVNEKVYGVATFAEGPDKDKMVYENAIVYMLKSLQINNSESATITESEALAKIKTLPEVMDYLKRVPNGLVSVNGVEDNSYLVQVYEIKDGHTATFNWYTVNKQTGEITPEFDN